MEEQLTIPSVDLILWNNDLSAVGVIGTRNGVLQDADGADDLALLQNADLATISRSLASTEIAGIANNLFGFNGLLARLHAHKLAIGVRDDLVNRLVKHVGTTVDGRETREGLWKLAETVKRVDVW